MFFFQVVGCKNKISKYLDVKFLTVCNLCLDHLQLLVHVICLGGLFLHVARLPNLYCQGSVQTRFIKLAGSHAEFLLKLQIC